MAAGAGGLTDGDDRVFIRECERDVRAALEQRLNDARGETIHIKSRQLEADLDTEHTNTRVGHAIARLAKIEDGLEITRWTAPTKTPILWEVSR